VAVGTPPSGTSYDGWRNTGGVESTTDPPNHKLLGAWSTFKPWTDMMLTMGSKTGPANNWITFDGVSDNAGQTPHEWMVAQSVSQNSGSGCPYRYTRRKLIDNGARHECECLHMKHYCNIGDDDTNLMSVAKNNWCGNDATSQVNNGEVCVNMFRVERNRQGDWNSFPTSSGNYIGYNEGSTSSRTVEGAWWVR